MKRILLLFIFLPLFAQAFPEAPFDALKYDPPKIKGVAQNFDFEGIVKLSNCSGAVVRFSGQPDWANALVLTNGHCVKRWGFLKPGEVWHNKKVDRPMRVADKNMKFHDVTAKLVLYATMTTTDSALYELKETYEELEDMGISAFHFSNEHPLIGTRIDIVSGYWERGYSCHIDDFVYELRESNWTFYDSVRYSPTGCEVIGGTSGSPIIEKGTREVIAINNTGNMNGRRCKVNNPCEVDEKGNVSVRKGINYGQQTYLFYNCLSFDFQIDLSRHECTLPK